VLIQDSIHIETQQVVMYARDDMARGVVIKTAYTNNILEALFMSPRTALVL
jgi:hypothetical protein